MRVAFQARYHAFKLLLAANHRSLQCMTEIEEALQGRRPFGMHFVRSRCTRMAAQVFQMTRHLGELAPGRYTPLSGRFDTIHKAVAAALESERPHAEGPCVVSLGNVDAQWVGRVGGKMANLGELRNRLGLRTPEGFVVTARGYRDFFESNDLQPEIDRLVQSADEDRPEALHALSAGLQQRVLKAPVPAELAAEIREHYKRLEEATWPGVPLALRSSALGEDTTEASFAGQYRSVLNVLGDHLTDAYREVAASKYSAAAIAYRFSRGIRDEDVDMCVGFLCMLDPVAGGVMYSDDPIEESGGCVVIHGVWGLPKAVVDGGVAVDRFVVSRGDPLRITQREVGFKESRLVCREGEGIRRIPVSEEARNCACLTDEQALNLARTALRLEAHYGSPRDIEWALDRDGELTLLQCRPLQRHPGEGAHDRELLLDEGGGEAAPGCLFCGGVTASRGVGAGPAFLVKRDADLLAFPAGAVLVTTQALPRWAAVLGRAAAVVTEYGGEASHLASVAREFGIPSLFGVRDAVSGIVPGQWVTVDADRRRIHDGRVDALLAPEPAGRNLMEGGAVYRVLEDAARHITPLRLLDPDSPSFLPQNCATFHDITRFCHEKSVQEMFRFGRDHHFPERSSKQLFCRVPMQWWVLNLDDGYHEEVQGRYVGIENIASVPMLALWEGITAVPWEGPPGVDGRGFLSVMFEATMNPALNTGVPTRYADRNYFMISRNFCNLNSRLGFHFSSVEALIGERLSENFARFLYRGGAADYARRELRVWLLRDVLESCGFRVEVRDDTLVARLDGFDVPFMQGRLRALGYLTMHTRQLDMIMSNEALVQQHRERLLEGIRMFV